MPMLFIVSGYFQEIEETDHSDLTLRDKYIHLKKILERSCKDITQKESLQFPSLFSRLVFITQKYDLPDRLAWQLQTIRKKTSFLLRSEQHLISDNEYQRAKKSLEDFYYFLNNGRLADGSFDDDLVERQEKELPLDKIRVQLLRVDRQNEILICQSEAASEQVMNVRYNRPVNAIFNPVIDRLWGGAQFNLIDVSIDAQGYYTPSSFVLEPDYLIDASSIAECFCNYGNSHLHYFRRKFEPDANSKHILLGNLANFFLDELVYADDADKLEFNAVFLNSFRQKPFEYAACNDIRAVSDFREFMAKALIQFNNIRRVVQQDMPANNLAVQDCVLEPSFFCEKYGFQGRLDMLQLARENGADRIIELKSGKAPFPPDDPTRIAPNHMAQTVVYRLMIESVFGKDSRNIYPMILYSSAERAGENLRYAARFRQLEKEILLVRNLIIATEHDLYIGDSAAVENVIDQLFNLDNYNRPPQFFIDKLKAIKDVLDSASSLEKGYFYRFISFITRELYLLKAGDESFDSVMSVSALWNTSFRERKENLELIDNLQIESIDDSGRDMVIYFSRRDAADCVNFREGEICILYPKESEEDSLLSNQILKGVVVKIATDRVILRFRYKQRNHSFFSRYQYWIVEHDKLDHSYNAMFKGLFSFLSSPSCKKELLLGLKPPVSSYKEPIDIEPLAQEQKQAQVIEKAMAADDYFLIVGPPGTGKTSLFAKELIRRYYARQDANILVMAYTNRAVDELCEAICYAFAEDAAACTKYIRIGTELSCKDSYRHRLLQHLSYQSGSRKELLDMIAGTRIFVGTLASIIGRPELFNLKHFNVAIIDEASQVLEPQLIGLLPQFDKFIMIGDHKQLSTITLQNEYKSAVEDSSLNDIGLFDCRESLFERLFNTCRKMGWSYAYDTLTYHGRMHQEIAGLVNIPFYDGQLKVATDRQLEPLHFACCEATDLYQSLIASRRVVFLPVSNPDMDISDKINRAEADEVVGLSVALMKLYKTNDRKFDPQKTLGVITPYRNQIAYIKQKLEETGIPELADIMVDTVERYQGSQRDVIILSFCFNRPYQLQYFSNMNREGTVDRKLNVALTRAREQLFLVGNEQILNQHPIYGQIFAEVPGFLTKK